MPTAVAGAALSGALAAGSGATVLGLTGASLGFAVFGANVALSGLSLALQKKPKAPDFGNFASQAANRSLTVRQPITEHRLVIGETRVGGPLVYIGQTENKKYLHYVVPLAAHEIDAIGTVFFDDYPVFDDDLDGDGNVTAGDYANKIRIKKYLGTPEQTADSDLVAESSEWTTDHRLRGRAYIYIRYEDDNSTFPGDIPPPSAMVRGAKLYDTRTDATEYSPNPSLAARWYQSGEYGYRTPPSGWEDDYTDAAANVCDEFVDTLAVDYEVDAVDASDDALDLVADENDILEYQTGDRVEVTSTGSVPPGLSGSMYVITVREKARSDKGLRIRLASSYSNALAGTAIDITDAGSGTITVSKTGEPRYTANGTIDTAEDPDEVIPKLLSAMGGLAVRSVSGTWRLHAAAYAAPTVTYDEDDLTAGFTTKLRLSARERVNGVHGVYSSPLNNWQPHDYPVVSSDDYEEEDARYRDTVTADAGTDVLTLTGDGGWFANAERIRFQTSDTLPSPLAKDTTYYAIRTADDALKVATTSDNALAGTAVDITDAGTGTHTMVRLDRILDELDLPFTTRPNTAQRLASIKLRKSRNEINVPVKLNMTGFLEQTGGTVGFDFDRYGWSGKVFETAEWKCFVENNDEGVPVIGTSMIWRETSSSAFDFNPANDEVAVSAAPRSALAAVGTVVAPTSLTLASGTAVLDTRNDGTIFSRLKASWTAPADQFVTSGGRIEVQYKKSAAADWIDAAPLPGATTETFILDVKDGTAYDVRIRGVNSAGVPSAWVTSSNHTVVGKTAPPANVASLSASQNGGAVVFKWPAIADADRAGYQIRYAERGSFVWNSATPVSEELIARGTTISTFLVPPGDWTFGIKAYDTSGNESATEATRNLVVSNANDIVLNAEQAPAWAGTLTNLEKHWTGKLVPSSTKAASAHTNDELFEQYVPYPESMCTYEAPEQDLGFDADGVRVWADIVSTLGPGETSGTADPSLSIDYKDNASSYDGFETWTIGTADFRQIKASIAVDTSKGKPVIEGFNLVCDVAERTESGTLTVGTGGESIVFDTPFHTTPVVHITPEGGLLPDKSNVTTTGFDLVLRNSAGTAVEDVADWTAEGA
jgi:hypothetical protein